MDWDWSIVNWSTNQSNSGHRKKQFPLTENQTWPKKISRSPQKGQVVSHIFFKFLVEKNILEYFRYILSSCDGIQHLFHGSLQPTCQVLIALNSLSELLPLCMCHWTENSGLVRCEQMGPLLFGYDGPYLYIYIQYIFFIYNDL